MPVEDLLNTPCGKRARSTLSPREEEILQRAEDAGYLWQRPPSEGSVPKKLIDSAFELYIGKVLAGPKTIAVNPVSLSIMTGFRFAESLSAIAASSIYRSPADRLKMGEFHAEVAGFQVGISEAVEFLGNRFNVSKNRMATNIDVAKQSGVPAELMRRSKLDSTVQVIQADTWGVTNAWMKPGLDWLGLAANLPGNTLGTTDLFFKIINFHATAGKESFRQADKDMYAKMAEDPTLKYDSDFVALRHDTYLLNAKTGSPGEDDIFDLGVKDADRRAFTANPDTGYGRTIVNTKFPGFRWVLPIRRAVVGAMESTFNRSPIGLIPSNLQTYQDLRSGDPARKADALGRMSAGMLAVGAMAMMFSGKITGSEPLDKYERAQWKKEGNEANSLYLTDGIRIPFRALGFLELPLKVLTAIEDYSHKANENTSDDSEDVLTGMYAHFGYAIADVMFNETAAKDIFQFLNAVQSVVKQADGKPMRVWAMRKLDTMAIGNLLIQATRKLDPYKHDLREPLDGLLARIPHYSKKVAYQIDFWGDQVPFHRGRDESIAYEFDGPNPVSKRMKALGMTIPNTTRTKEGVTLTPMEFERWSQYAGKGDPRRPKAFPSMYQRLLREMRRPTFEKYAGDSARIIDIRRAVREGREGATELLKRDPDFDFNDRVEKNRADALNAQKLTRQVRSTL